MIKNIPLAPVCTNPSRINHKNRGFIGSLGSQYPSHVFKPEKKKKLSTHPTAEQNVSCPRSYGSDFKQNTAAKKRSYCREKFTTPSPPFFPIR